MNFMKVGIIGSGIVGRVLGTGFLQEGHQVKLGTRDTGKSELQQWEKENTGASLGSFEDAAKFTCGFRECCSRSN